MDSFIVCQKCGVKNTADASVCTACNTPLGVKCAECNRLNPSLLTYCEYCGAALVKNLPEEMTSDAERIHLNIMFCDLVGSTGLSETLDPEMLRDIVVAYQEECAIVIEEQGGYIAQYLGDGILVYFGFPKTFEDNSQRAVQAGLNIVENIKLLSERLVKEGKPAIAVRIGIHAGLVVIGEVGGGGTHERLALGEPPNIAARIQTLAEPNEVLISAEVYKIVQKIIYCQEKGTHNLKGISTPITVYQPISIELTKSFTRDQTRYEYPLIGRERVISQLQAAWKKVLSGKIQTIILRGEIGTGKSHVSNYFISSIPDKSAQKIFFKCTSYTQNNSFFPFVNILNMLMELEKDDDDNQKLHKVEKFLGSLQFNLTETVPIVGSLLSIPLSDQYVRLSSSMSVIREKTFKFFKNLFVRLSEGSPIIVVIEDIHYADKWSLELCKRLLHSGAHRILYLLTSRVEFNFLPPGDKYYHYLDLSPLDKKDSERIILQITGNKNLPDEIMHLIIEKTQGIPLFIEELMSVILDSGVLKLKGKEYILKGTLPDSLIPSTLQDLLFSKLDQLGKAKEVAQLAAVFGREFTADMLQTISGLNFETLSEDLKTLVNESVLVVKGKLPNIHFAFKQALMQEKAYQLLLISKRQQYHLMIAEALEKNYSVYVKSNPDFVAHHYTLGEKFISAIEYWYKAGVLSQSRSAFDEAIVFFQRGMELIPAVHKIKERNSLELKLLSGLAPSLLTVKGYTDESVGPAFERAYELVSRMKNLPHLSSVLSGLWAHYTALGKHERASVIAKRLRGIASRTEDSIVEFEAAKALGGNFFWRGQFTSAKKILGSAIKNFNPETRYQHSYLYAEHPVVSSHCYYALASWMLGNHDEAEAASSTALSYAKKLNHPFTITYSLGFTTLLHHLRGDVKKVKAFSKETMQMGEQNGFSFWQESGNIFYQWAVAAKNPEKGVAEMEESVLSIRNAGTLLWIPNLLGMLAELYGKIKQRRKASAMINEALRLANRNGEKFFYTELLRIKGELLLASRKKSEAKKFFTRMIQIARKQKAENFLVKSEKVIENLN